MIERDSFMTGFVLAAILPVLGYICVKGLFDILIDLDIMGLASMHPTGQRMRTIYILAICFNLIALNVFKRWKADNSMRGMVIPTLFYAAAWMYLFLGGGW